MTDNTFKFCPKCGSQNIRTLNGGYRWHCPDCDFDLYHNTAAATGGLIIEADGRVMFTRRAKDPCKDMLDVPGGFCDPDETAEAGFIRECVEELGITPINVKYIASFPNTYDYKGIANKTCDLFFTAELPADAQVALQESEISGIEWHAADTREQIMALPLAFPSTRRALLARIGIFEE